MANAVRYDTKPGVTLNLTISEARTLMTIFFVVGGHPDNSLRGLTDNINRALRAEGISPFSEYVDGPLMEGGRGAIQFVDGTMGYTREDPPGEPT